MSHISQIVLTGYVGTAPKLWNTNSQTPLCTFRVASTRRYFNPQENQWKSAKTTWIRVKVLKNLAKNVMKSIHVGDPIIVIGNLSIDSWEKDGVNHNVPVIDVTSIGHNLTTGTTFFTKEEIKNDESHTVHNEHDSTESLPSDQHNDDEVPSLMNIVEQLDNSISNYEENIADNNSRDVNFSNENWDNADDDPESEVREYDDVVQVF